MHTGTQETAPWLWRLVGIFRRRTDRAQLPGTQLTSSGAELWTPFRDTDKFGGSNLPSGKALLLIRVGLNPWQRWRVPILIQRGIEPAPVYVIALSVRGVTRMRGTVDAARVGARHENISCKINIPNHAIITPVCDGTRIVTDVITKLNQTGETVVRSLRIPLRVSTPKVALTNRDLPTVSYRFRRCIRIPPFSPTARSSDVRP